MSGILINEGTQTNIQSDTVGTQQYPIVKIDRGAAGLSSLFTGTIDAVTNIAGGTITRINGGSIVGTLAGGTLQAGTINVGTVSTVGILHADRWGTTVTTGTSTLGTIKPLVAGSSIYITDLVISVGSATNIVIGDGGTSTPILGTMFFNANSGVAYNFITPRATTAGSALVFQQSSAISPISITALGFVK